MAIAIVRQSWSLAVISLLIATVVPVASGSEIVPPVEAIKPEYESWISKYRTPLREHGFFDPESTARQLDEGVKLEVMEIHYRVEPVLLKATVISGDEPPPIDLNEHWEWWFRRRTSGRIVSTTGLIYLFRSDSRSLKGGEGDPISPDDLRKLTVLLTRLPTDGHRLPPPGQRIVLQSNAHGFNEARVYDTTQIPPEVAEILRLSCGHNSESQN